MFRLCAIYALGQTDDTASPLSSGFESYKNTVQIHGGMQLVNSYDPLTLKICISNDLNDPGVFIVAPYRQTVELWRPFTFTALICRVRWH